MRAEDYTNKVAEATKRLREADSDEARNDAIADLEALQGQAIDAPPKPVDTVEALTEAAPKLVEQIREAAKKEGGENVEALQAQLKEAQGALSQFTDVVDLGTRLREAGVSDETELRYFAGQARSRGLREATDIKEMVEAERAYHKRQQDALDERLKEATEGLDMFGIEGAFAREPAGGGDSGAAGLASLRESGVPMKKTPAAA